LKCGSLRGIIHGTKKLLKKEATMKLNTIQRIIKPNFSKKINGVSMPKELRDSGIVTFISRGIEGT